MKEKLFPFVLSSYCNPSWLYFNFFMESFLLYKWFLMLYLFLQKLVWYYSSLGRGPEISSTRVDAGKLYKTRWYIQVKDKLMTRFNFHWQYYCLQSPFSICLFFFCFLAHQPWNNPSRVGKWPWSATRWWHMAPTQKWTTASGVYTRFVFSIIILQAFFSYIDNFKR